MLVIRRTALRALSARPTSFSLLPSSAHRTFVTQTSQTLSRQSRLTAWSLQRRFASDEAKPSEETVTDETVPEETVTVIADEPIIATGEGAINSSPTSDQSDAVVEAVVTSREPAVDPLATEDVTESQAAIESATTSFPSVGGPRRPFNIPEHEIAANNTVYVGNIFFETTEADLRSFFESYGPIESVKLIYDPRGLSKGFGYIAFENVEDATRAIEGRNQEVFQGRRLTVQYHRRRASNMRDTNRPPAEPSKTLFIGNMSFEMSDKDLNDLFRDIRNVIDVRVAIDRRSGQPRGFAHADFIDIPSATKAKEVLQGKEIYGRRLRVDYGMSSVDRARQAARVQEPVQ